MCVCSKYRDLHVLIWVCGDRLNVNTCTFISLCVCYTGIVAVLEDLVVDDVGGEMQNTDPIGANVVPDTARESTSSDSLSLNVTVSQDPTVDSYCKSGLHSCLLEMLCHVCGLLFVIPKLSIIIIVTGGSCHKYHFCRDKTDK